MSAIDLDSEKSLDMVALGAAIVDILAFVEDAFLAEHHVTKAGMTLIDHAQAETIHAAMKQVAAQPPREISGGSAANTAAGFASLGGKVAFVGKTRDDALGHLFREDIRRVGVDFDVTPFDHDANQFGGTARSMIMVTPDAQRSMATDLGVSGWLTRADLPEETLKDAKIVYLEGYLWDQPNTKDAFRAAAALAAEANGKVALTLSDTFCVERHRESFQELVQHGVDILFANEAEILALYQIEDLDKALEQASNHTEIVVVTCGEKGCRVVAKDQQLAVPALPIEKLVDTTGAGDLFAAGFLYGLVSGAKLEDCARMGCLSASEVIQHLGARPQQGLKALFAQHGWS